MASSRSPQGLGDHLALHSKADALATGMGGEKSLKLVLETTKPESNILGETDAATW